MNPFKRQLESGQALIESIVATAVFSLVVVSLLSSLVVLASYQVRYRSRIQAAQYAREGLEITYNVMVNVDDWEDFVASHVGSFYPNVGDGGLELVELTGEEDEPIEGSEGMYAWRVTIAEVWRSYEDGEIVDEGVGWKDGNTLKVVSRVSWQESGGPQEIKLSTYLINLGISED